MAGTMGGMAIMGMAIMGITTMMTAGTTTSAAGRTSMTKGRNQPCGTPVWRGTRPRASVRARRMREPWRRRARPWGCTPAARTTGPDAAPVGAAGVMQQRRCLHRSSPRGWTSRSGSRSASRGPRRLLARWSWAASGPCPATRRSSCARPPPLRSQEVPLRAFAWSPSALWTGWGAWRSSSRPGRARFRLQCTWRPPQAAWPLRRPGRPSSRPAPARLRRARRSPLRLRSGPLWVFSSSTTKRCGARPTTASTQ
mmetsp:Transcript_55548/g.153776  ORF Transcript_55548/g.153776 Transcript_55548/m.153776 type:complete len:254 (+) Transcript_55548:343-1104(+)